VGRHKQIRTHSGAENGPEVVREEGPDLITLWTWELEEWFGACIVAQTQARKDVPHKVGDIAVGYEST
jgi:hypothetical protein